jgi:hypothetical protein
MFKLLPVALLISFVFLAHAELDLSYYHTTDEINEELVALQDKCGGNLYLETLLEDPKIYLAHITKNTSEIPEEDKYQMYIVFGEHSREMISPETGLYTAKVLCGVEDHPEKFDIDNLLEKNHFALLINANPTGRELVEAGNWCQRVNANGVDLNRNWDNHWIYERGTDTDSGPKPFSEIETRTMRDSVTKFDPDMFLIVHSGTYGLYTPYAYGPADGAYNQDKMMTVLNAVDQKYCNCNPGSAAREIGYNSPGTSVDYAYDQLKVPYSFAWEIYGPPEEPAPMLVHQDTPFALKNHLKSYGEQKVLLTPLEILTRARDLSNEQCFHIFNPENKDDYDDNIQNWSAAILTATGLINDIEDGNTK